ncbi:NAD(P)H-dependent oxidoreductase, partial [Millionella massiliensis]|uniref:NAD(P)H-dependent oxidoreductase n=1 Tax=Millionella massiliensis TaxID=1871023 RepID=UPI0023A86300
AVVFTMPTYWYSIPAQIKGVIDRLFSFVVGGKDIAGKKCGLMRSVEAFCQRFYRSVGRKMV